MEDKKLIIIRHAHRDTDQGRSKNNGLSEKGDHQAKILEKYAKQKFEKSSDLFFVSSPKKRCIETLDPMVRQQKTEIRIDARLDEQLMGETSEAFLRRIQDFIAFWKQECPPVTVVCSHGDWIPNLVQELTHAKIGIKKAGWIEIDLIAGEPYLTWLLQNVSFKV